MITRSKIITASLTMGLVGAAIGGFYGYEWASGGGVGIGAGEILPVSIPVGFLACFSLSMVYLKDMKDKAWKEGIATGASFGSMAGAIAGLLTSSVYCIVYNFANVIHSLLYDLFFPAFIGLLQGAFTGAVIGLISSLTAGRFVLEWLKK
jgi:hypothetical protein